MSDYAKVALSENGNHPCPKIRVYKQRWIILGLFIICSASTIMQWLQYSIIANTIVDYYGVSYTAVDWSSMIFMLAYLLFIFPGCYILDTWGLRTTMLISMAGTCIGSWIKVASVSPDRYWVVLVGQGLVGIFKVSMVAIPPKLASVWFAPNQVSLACSFGVFGIQLGVALGFLVPPMLVNNHTEKDMIEESLYVMNITTALLTSILFVLVCIFFKEKPPLPPSPAQMQIENTKESNNFCQSLKTLFANRSYVLLVFSGGISIGFLCAFSTMLNQLILKHYPDGAKDAGRIGLLLVFGGMIGSVAVGVVLDAFKRFKETILTVYAMCIFSVIAFTFILGTRIVFVYLAAALLGVTKPLLPIQYRLASELTYPIGEGTSSGIVSVAAQIFGIIFTYLYSYLLNTVDDKIANLTMSGMLGIAAFLLCFIRYDLRRQKVQCLMQDTELAKS